ncbi:hypothetical protein L7F22_023620 [Adiantum nelumboides]|nr:hypothetical protein [Adiantum nelumboides]
MVVLTSTFLDCSLVAPQTRSRPSLVDAQSARNVSFLATPSASVHKTDEEHDVQHRKGPSASSWISFFLAGGASQKPPLKPLLEDVNGTPVDEVAATETSNTNVHPDYVRSPSKKGHKAARRVSFTPQKARELRKKLKDTDTFHDLMYHSAIASRLANEDS